MIDITLPIPRKANAGNTIQFVVQSLQTAKVGQINYLGEKKNRNTTLLDLRKKNS